MAGTANNGAMEPLRSGTSMNWRMHDEFTQGILADGFGMGGETMYGDLIFFLTDFFFLADEGAEEREWCSGPCVVQLCPYSFAKSF